MHVDFDPLQVDWTPLLGGGGGGFHAPDDYSGTTWEVLSGGGTGATTHCNRTNAAAAAAANTLLMLGSGGGGAAYPVFAGLPYQRGAGGLGSMFRSFLRFLVPIGRQAGAALGRQGLESGARVLSSVLDGADLKQSLVTEGRTGLKNLLDKAADSVAKSQQQQQQQKGGGGGGGGGGNFDFKRYRKHLVAAAPCAAAAAVAPTSAFGPGRIKSGNPGIFSTIGPHDDTDLLPFSNQKQLPPPLQRRARKRAAANPPTTTTTLAVAHKQAGAKKRRPLRFDTLGNY